MPMPAVLSLFITVKNTNQFYRVMDNVTKSTVNYKEALNKVNKTLDAKQQALDSSTRKAFDYKKIYNASLKEEQKLINTRNSFQAKSNALMEDYNKISSKVTFYKDQIATMPTGAKAVLSKPLAESEKIMNSIGSLQLRYQTAAEKLNNRLANVVTNTNSALTNYNRQMSIRRSSQAFLAAHTGMIGKLKLFTKEIGITKSMLYEYLHMIAATAVIALGMYLSKVTFEVSATKKRLAQVFGSTAKGNQAWEWAKAFSLSGKADLKGITDAFTWLIRYGIQPTTARMETLKDVSLMTGRKISNVAQAIANASFGQFRQLEYLGIDKKQIMNIAPDAFSGTGITAKVVDQKKVVDAIFKHMNSPVFKGQARKMVEGYTGEVLKLKNLFYVAFVNLADRLEKPLCNILYRIRGALEIILPLVVVVFRAITTALNIASVAFKRLSVVMFPLLKVFVLFVSYKGIVAVVFWISRLKIIGTIIGYIRLFVTSIWTLVGAIRALIIAQIQERFVSIINFITSTYTKFVTAIMKVIKFLRTFIAMVKAGTLVESMMLVVTAMLNGMFGNWASILSGIAAGAAVIALLLGSSYLLDKGLKKILADSSKIPEVAKLMAALRAEESKNAKGWIDYFLQNKVDYFDRVIDKLEYFRELMDKVGNNKLSENLKLITVARLNNQLGILAAQAKLIEVQAKNSGNTFEKLYDKNIPGSMFAKVTPSLAGNDSSKGFQEAQKYAQEYNSIQDKIWETKKKILDLTTKQVDKERLHKEIIGGGDLAQLGVSSWEVWKKTGEKFKKAVDNPKFNIKVDVKGEGGLENFVRQIAEQLLKEVFSQLYSAGVFKNV